jgi:hypothetical protein
MPSMFRSPHSVPALCAGEETHRKLGCWGGGERPAGKEEMDFSSQNPHLPGDSRIPRGSAPPRPWSGSARSLRCHCCRGGAGGAGRALRPHAARWLARSWRSRAERADPEPRSRRRPLRTGLRAFPPGSGPGFPNLGPLRVFVALSLSVGGRLLFSCKSTRSDTAGHILQNNWNRAKRCPTAAEGSWRSWKLRASHDEVLLLRVSRACLRGWNSKETKNLLTYREARCTQPTTHQFQVENCS